MVGGQSYPVGKCGLGQWRVGGQSYPVGKCGWVKGELEVNAILQGSVDGSRESRRSKLSYREVWVGQGELEVKAVL